MSVIESVVENVVVGDVERVVNPKVAKLQVKYERLYMSLFTVLNSFCIPAETEGDFVLKKEDMRKILDAVEFYSDDVSLQSMFMEENILSKENVKSVRKLMKEERYEWKVDNGLVEKKKKKRGAKRGEKVVVEKKEKKEKKNKKEKKVKEDSEVKEVVDSEVKGGVDSEMKGDSESKVVEGIVEKGVVEGIVEKGVVEKVVKGKVKKDKVKKGEVVLEEKKDVILEEKKEEKKDVVLEEKKDTPKMEIPKKKTIKKPKKDIELVSDLPLTH
jgi:hypothetical protein